RRRNADRLRRERRRDHRQPAQPARHAHLRPGRARAAREELHEDRLTCPGGALSVGEPLVPPRASSLTAGPSVPLAAASAAVALVPTSPLGGGLPPGGDRPPRQMPSIHRCPEQ